MKCRVTQNYTRTYPDPIRGKRGDALEIGEPDPDNPDWIWCVGPERRWGWVHYSVIDRNLQCLAEDYDARELDVEACEIVTVEKTLSSWARCINEIGETGWVPVSCLEEIST